MIIIFTVVTGKEKKQQSSRLELKEYDKRFGHANAANVLTYDKGAGAGASGQNNEKQNVILPQSETTADVNRWICYEKIERKFDGVKAVKRQYVAIETKKPKN